MSANGRGMLTHSQEDHRCDLLWSELWEKACRQFAGRDFSALRSIADCVPELNLERFESLLYPHKQDMGGTTADNLSLSFKAAAKVEGGVTVFAFYLYGLALKRWELSLDHTAIHQLVTAAQKEFDHTLRGTNLTDPDRTLAQLVLDLAGSLSDCMKVENGLNCSCPPAMADHARSAVRHAEQVQANLVAHHLQGLPCARYLQQAAGAQREYFKAVICLATAVKQFLDNRRTSRDTLDNAIRALEQAESTDELRGDVYESELRAHRLTLCTMRELVDADSIQVDEASVVYCYPFTLPALDPKDALAEVEKWPTGFTLDKAQVVSVQGTALSDTWEGRDPANRRYCGLTLHLADLSVTTTGLTVLPAHRPEIRLSRLGNHYLRVSAPLTNASPHHLYQALRRGRTQMGEEELRQLAPHGGLLTGRWTRLVDYAADVVNALGRNLADLTHPVSEQNQGVCAAPDTGLLARLDVNNRHHTVLSIRALSVQDADGRSAPVDNYKQVVNAMGWTQLLQPIAHASATLEEYVRHHKSATRKPIDIGFRGETILQTPQLTTLITPTSPNFMIIPIEEIAEFAGTIPALLDEWTNIVYQQRDELARRIMPIDPAATKPAQKHGSADVAQQLVQLERRQLHLQDVVTRARSLLAFLTSPALVSPTRNRQLLDKLLAGCEFDRLRADLEAQIAEVDNLYQRVQALLRQLEERRQRQYRTVVEVALVLLAVLSLADFITLFNGAFSVREGIIRVEVIAVLVCVTVSGLLFWLFWRTEQRWRDE
jgi:hypothetical protein